MPEAWKKGDGPQQKDRRRTKSSKSGSIRKLGPKRPDSPVPEGIALPADLAQSWLVWQCQMVAGVIRGAIYSKADKKSDETEVLIASWNDEGGKEVEMKEICREVFTDGHGVIRARQNYGEGELATCDLIGCPLVADDTIVGVVILMISTRSKSQQHAVLQLLQWGGIWVEKLVQHDMAKRQEFGNFSTNLLTAALELPALSLTTLEIANRLADRFDCERVSVGLRKGMSIQLLAVSHNTKFDPRTQLVRRIEAAMEEATDQLKTINFNGSRRSDRTPLAVRAELTAVVKKAHYELSRQQSFGSTCTVVLRGQFGYIGAVTFERPANHPFDKETIENCESIAKLVGPVLEMKQRDERHFFQKGIAALSDMSSDIFGPAHLKLKVFSIAALLLLVISSLFNGMNRVTAPATIEGAVRHMLVAPQAGYIKQSISRAGDLVKKGQLIAQLDDRDLSLELQKWQGEKNKLQKVYQEALAQRDRTKLSVTLAQIEQVEAEMKLVEGNLSRTSLIAPFDGVVVSGDFSQSLGAPVEMGQILFEVAPLDSYQVVLEVDEFDVAGLEAGQSGRMVIAALPEATFEVSISKIVPVAVAGDGRNYFRVEATLDQSTSMLRPGMQGVAKVDAGERRLLWIWTHSLTDRLRLWVWSAGL